MEKLKNLKFRNFIVLLFAGVINAIGVTVFLQPVKLYDGGISGTSMLLAQITPHFLSLSFFLIVLNVPIFIFGLTLYLIFDYLLVSSHLPIKPYFTGFVGILSCGGYSHIPSKVFVFLL